MTEQELKDYIQRKQNLIFEMQYEQQKIPAKFVHAHTGLNERIGQATDDKKRAERQLSGGIYKDV